LSGAPLVIRWDSTNAGNGKNTRPFADTITIKNTTTAKTLVTSVIPYNAANATLPAGDSRTREFGLVLPDGPDGAGQLEITITTDSNNQVDEINDSGTAESNNSASHTVSSLLAPYPDVQVTDLQIVPAAGVQSGDAILIRWNDRNTGTAPASGSWYDQIVIKNITTGETLVSTALNKDGDIPPNQFKARQHPFTVPDGLRGAGQIQVTISADFHNRIFEHNAGNNAETNNRVPMSWCIGRNATMAMRP
jgi:hypothetical protein